MSLRISAFAFLVGLWSLYARAAEVSNDAVALIQSRAAIVWRHERYCTGYHCYDFSQNFCERYGEADCESLLIRPKNQSFGHVMNVARQVNTAGTEATYCVIDPQIHASFAPKQCWTGSLKEQDGKDPWTPPNLDAICVAQPAIAAICLSGHFNPFQRVYAMSSADLHRGSPYSPWWENPGHSAGQLLWVCQTKNEEQEELRARSGADPADQRAISRDIPSCDERRTQAPQICAKDANAAVACRNDRPLGCAVLQCRGKELQATSWAEMNLPDCRSEVLVNYCQNWFAVVDQGGEFKALDQNSFARRYTYHYCRNGYGGPQQFQCSGNAQKADYELTRNVK